MSGFAGLMALAWLIPAAWAATGSVGGTSALAQFGAHREEVEDMRVKVLGGHIRVVRNWDKDAWYINRRWAPIKEIFDSASTGTSTSADSAPGAPTLERGGNYYVWKSGNTYVDEDDVRKTLTKTETGWRWADRKGNWVEYNAERKPVSYGDRNDVTVSLKYDAEGHLTGVFDHVNKQILWYEYNPEKQISAIRDYTNRKVQYLYTGGQLTAVIDVRGHTWHYGYTDGMLTSKTDPEGRVTTLSYNGTIVASIKDASNVGSNFKYEYNKTRKEFYKQEKASSGKITETWYDIEGDLIRQDINGQTILTIQKDGRRRIETDSAGNITTKEYDEWDNLTKITYADGSSVIYQIDPVYSNVLQKTDEKGVITKYEYGTNGRLIKMTEALGLKEQRITEYGYDINGYGNLISVKRLGDAVTQMAETIYTYDAFGNVDTKTDPEKYVTDYIEYDAIGNITKWKDTRGKLWQRTYDNAGNLTSETNPLLHVTKYQYDKVNNRTHRIDAHDRVTEFKYDQSNRLVAVVDPFGAIIQRNFNARGQLESVIDEEGKEIHYNYDALARRIAVIDGDGDVTAYKYGEVDSGAKYNAVSTIVYPSYTEKYRYDKRGRHIAQIRVTVEHGELLTQRRFGGSGNLIEVIDAAQRRRSYTYDALDRLIKITDALNKDIIYAYDNRDNLIQVTNQNNVLLRQFQYDRSNNQIEEKWPLDKTFTYTYDSNGNLSKKIDAKGQIATFFYDDASRLDAIEYFVNSTATAPGKTVNFDYDKINRLLGYQDGTTSASYTYDDAQRSRTETVNYGPFSKSFTDTYYRNGLKRVFTSPEGIIYGYNYDASNQLNSITIPGEGAITYNTYQWYLPTKVTLPGGGSKEYQYDSLMRTKHVTGRDPAGTAFLDYAYDYDVVGNIKSNTTEHGIYSYDYDDLHRLKSASNPSLPNEIYSYDPAANRKTDNAISGEWQYNANDQLTDYGGNKLQYDSNGSPTQKTVNGQTLTYVYNIENRLQQIKDASQTIIAGYYYDPFGRRLWKEVSGSKTYFLYAREGLIAEYDSSGQPKQSYGYSPDSQFGTMPLYTRTANGYAYYHTDHLGTSKVLTRGNGEVVWAATSSAFGQTTVSIAGVNNPLRFPGQYYDQESGLHYNWHRYYDPSIGRYISSDPIGLTGGLHAYGYVRANPLKFFDIYGLYTSDFYAAEDLLEKVSGDLKLTLPHHYTVKEAGLREILTGLAGYTDPVWYDWLPWLDREVGITDWWGDEACLTDEQAKQLLNTYIHETLHYNQGFFIDYLMQYGQSENYRYGTEEGIGDVFHNKIYEISDKMTDQLFDEYNKLRKEYARENGFDMSCTCK